MSKRNMFMNVLMLCFTSVLINACIKDTTLNNNTGTGSSNLKDTSYINVKYGSHVRQVYDIYLPAKRDSNTPVILMIHGGAWKEGKKEDFNSYLNQLKTKWSNVAIVNMNYRLASNQDHIHHNEIISDIDSVVNQIIVNKSTYQISSKIGVMGASAGAQLAMIYAYKYNSTIKCVGNIFGPSIISDWSWYNSNNIFLGGYVGDILTQYVGQSWDTTAYKEVSPYWNITNKSQPTITFHGSLDPIVPVYQSQWLHNKLKSLGVISEYHEYIAFHGFDGNQTSDVLNELVAFFKKYLE